MLLCVAYFIEMCVFVDAGVCLAPAQPAVRRPACPLRRPAPPSSLPTAPRPAPVLSARTPGQRDTVTQRAPLTPGGGSTGSGPVQL